MWRRTLTKRCFAQDVATGIPSDYRPRYRPRRLVMPVDTWNIHSKKRNVNPEYSKYRERMSLAKSVRKKGALKMSSVPVERTAADAVRLALENAEKSGFTNITSVLPSEGKALYTQILVSTDKEVHDTSPCGTSSIVAGAFKIDVDSLSDENLHLDGDITTIGTSLARTTHHGGGALQQRGRTIWGLLEKTTMDAPAHGFLSLLGKSLVEQTVLSLLYEHYPRIRSLHAQRLVHQATGLYSIGRVATQLGLVDIFGVHMEVGLWREMNVLRERLKTGRQMATLHKERMTLGIGAQKRWYWRNVLKSAGRKLKRLPVHENDLRPRMEWLRDQVFQFIAAVDAMEGSYKASVLIKRLFCSQLLRYSVCRDLVRRTSLIKDGDEKVARSNDAKKLLVSMMENSWSSTMHPLDARGLEMREATESSGGAHAMHPLKRRGYASVDHVSHMAPQLVADLIEPQHAFRESQIVLRYAPFVAPELRDAPIDVDVVVRNQVEVEEMNHLNSLVQAQQFQQVQYRVARLYAGHECVGEGKGESDIQAMQMASTHMLQNYYLRRFSDPDRERDGVASENTETAYTVTPPIESAPRIRSVVSQSTVVL